MDTYSHFANPMSGFGRLLPEAMHASAYNLNPSLAPNVKASSMNKMHGVNTHNSELDHYAPFIGGGGAEKSNNKLIEVPSAKLHGSKSPELDYQPTSNYLIQPPNQTQSQSHAHNAEHTMSHLSSCKTCKDEFDNSIASAVKHALMATFDYVPEAFENMRDGGGGEHRKHDWRNWARREHELYGDKHRSRGGWDIQSVLVSMLIVILVIDLAIRRSSR